MLNRRSFFANLLVAGSIPFVPGLPPEKHADADTILYKGYTLHFSGWKQSSNSDFVVCQWLAYPNKKPSMHYYASYPGGEGKFWPGMMFDTCVRDHQEVIGAWHPHEHMEEIRLECLLRLMKVIDNA